MRFASVYKDFQEITDFERELGVLLQKKVPAKRARAEPGTIRRCRPASTG